MTTSIFFYNCPLHYMNVSKRLSCCFGKFWLNLFHPEWSVSWQLHWKSGLLLCLHKLINNPNIEECGFMVDMIKLVWWEKLIKLLGAQTWKLGERFEHFKVWPDLPVILAVCYSTSLLPATNVPALPSLSLDNRGYDVMSFWQRHEAIT